MKARQGTPKHRLLIVGSFGCVVLILAAWMLYVSLQAKPHAELSHGQGTPAGNNLSQSAVPSQQVQKPDVHLPAVVDGVAPVVYRLATKEKVVFLGIDDGAYKNPEVVELLQKYNIHASLYLSDAFIHGNPGFFNGVSIATGSLVEDHSVSHDTDMSKKSYEYQKQEICGMADLEQKYYGRRPVFFRPPGGAYTATTQQAAAACGMKAVVTWIAKSNGGSMQYQVGNVLRPGDVVLMHFRPEFRSDLKAFVDAETAAGLHTELLEDWL